MTPEAWKIIGAVLAPNIGGWAGSFIVRKNFKGFYDNLKKPTWTPPNWLFGPVWTSLYASMGYASYLVYRDGGGFDGRALGPLILYGTQLVLNWTWTPVFFGLHNLKLSLVNIGLLYANVVACGFAFFQVNQVAGLIFIPYLIWLTTATALNYAVYRDNPKIKEVED